MIGELEAAFIRAAPSFAATLARMRAEHKFTGDELNLATILDQLGFQLGSTATEVPTSEILQVLKVVERVLADGSEQQKWAVTHFLMSSLQSAIKSTGMSTDAILPHLGPASARWWNDLASNPAAAEDW